MRWRVSVKLYLEEQCLTIITYIYIYLYIVTYSQKIIMDYMQWEFNIGMSYT